MSHINETQYNDALAKIEKLLPLIDGNTSIDDPNLLELKRVSDIVENYELEHYQIGKSPYPIPEEDSFMPPDDDSAEIKYKTKGKES